MSVRILTGDVRDMLATLPDESVHCVVSSPPYWGLRDYGVDGQLGMEPTMGEHIETMVAVFRAVRRVLRTDGTVWLNYGDCYAATQGGRQAAIGELPKDGAMRRNTRKPKKDRTDVDVGGWSSSSRGSSLVPGADDGLKPKDLCQIPNRLAQALQEPYYIGKIKRLEDRVWLAAIIDGEGSIFIHRQPEGTQTGRGRKYKRTQDNFCVGIAISNTSEALVAHAAAIFGKDNLQRYEPAGNRKPHWQWRIAGNLAKNILREVYPYLVAKQREARIAINCPPSGDISAASWVALKCLHKGRATDFDAAPPGQDDLWEQGWWVRSEIIWSKPNPMPESVTDRPATAHEKVWLLSKSARYFYDAEAVRRPIAPGSVDRYAQDIDGQEGSHRANGGAKTNGTMKAVGEPNGANLRNVWAIPTKGFSGAHFATFPPALVEPCIKAGTSEKGCCAECGAPWVREIVVGETLNRTSKNGHGNGELNNSGRFGDSRRNTAGWSPSCACDAATIPCTILDPFIGSGTTAMVADRLGRNCIGIDLNPANVEMSTERVTQDAGMFAEVS